MIYLGASLLFGLGIWGSPYFVARGGHIAITLIIFGSLKIKGRDNNSFETSCFNAFLFLILSFLRAELMLGYFFFCLRSIFLIFKSKNNLPVYLYYGLIILALIWPVALGFTPLNDSTSHSFIALKQLISVKIHSNFGSLHNPMIDYNLILGSSNYETISDLIKSQNYRYLFLFIWHFLINLDLIPKFVIESISGISIPWISGIGFGFLLILFRSKFLKLIISQELSPLVIAFWISVLMSIVYHPQSHYGHGLIVLLLSILILKSDKIKFLKHILFTLSIVRSFVTLSQFPLEQPIRDTARIINNLPIHSPINILESDNVYAAYVPNVNTSIVAYRMEKPLCEVINENLINIIVVSNNMLTTSGFNIQELQPVDSIICHKKWSKIIGPNNVLIYYIESSNLTP